MSGATIALISLRKIMLITRRFKATWGQSCPMAAPATIAINIQVVSERLDNP